MDASPQTFDLSVAAGDGEQTWAVTVSGELDLASSPLMEATLDGLTGQGAVRVVLDLSDVTFVDSSGLRAILSATDRLESAGGRLTIDGLSVAARRILEVTGLLESFRA